LASDRAKEIRDALQKLYDHIDDVQLETLKKLSAMEALHIIDFHANSWIDTISWISSKYARQEQMNIVMLHFIRVFKEIYWIQLLFQNANYPMMYRNLRYILEMMCQAYYVEIHHHGLTLDEQLEKAREIEQRGLYGWNLMRPVLCEVFGEHLSESHFHPLWIRLCRHAHPSPTETDATAMADFSILVTDSFNEELAREAMRTTDDVFDAVFAIVFRRFPE